MPRRVNLPTADDLFRPTVVPDVPDVPDPADLEGASGTDEATVAEPRPRPRRAARREQPGPRTPSGRVKHDEKMTVYVTAEELLDLEHARLTLRRSGYAVDRGRLVREALAIVLADLDSNGEQSVLVQRLSSTP